MMVAVFAPRECNLHCLQPVLLETGVPGVPAMTLPCSWGQMPLPTLKPAEVWAEEDATATLTSLQERTWDSDSIITRGREIAQEDRGWEHWMGTG